MAALKEKLEQQKDVPPHTPSKNQDGATKPAPKPPSVFTPATASFTPPNKNNAQSTNNTQRPNIFQSGSADSDDCAMLNPKNDEEQQNLNNLMDGMDGVVYETKQEDMSTLGQDQTSQAESLAYEAISSQTNSIADRMLKVLDIWINESQCGVHGVNEWTKGVEKI